MKKSRIIVENYYMNKFVQKNLRKGRRSQTAAIFCGAICDLPSALP